MLFLHSKVTKKTMWHRFWFFWLALLFGFVLSFLVTLPTYIPSWFGMEKLLFFLLIALAVASISIFVLQTFWLKQTHILIALFRFGLASFAIFVGFYFCIVLLYFNVDSESLEIYKCYVNKDGEVYYSGHFIDVDYDFHEIKSYKKHSFLPFMQEIPFLPFDVYDSAGNLNPKIKIIPIEGN